MLTFHWVASEKPLSIMKKKLKIAKEIKIGVRAGEGQAYANLGNALLFIG